MSHENQNTETILGKSSYDFSCLGRGEREYQTLTDLKSPCSYFCPSSRIPGIPARLSAAPDQASALCSIVYPAVDTTPDDASECVVCVLVTYNGIFKFGAKPKSFERFMVERSWNIRAV
uniref:SFRICE_021157 n=1 Tax=Spodoptera frugiperda TaxID=7108 RepID=A0A2H1VMA7_SPOFR